MQKKLDGLLKAADFTDDIEIVRQHLTADGYYVITLNKDLGKEQTERFIKNVKQHDEVEGIWENSILMIN